MLGMYKDENGVRCLPFEGGLITVRPDGEVLEVSLHTDHYLSPYREPITYTDAVYGITLWTYWCHEEYLEPTVMKLIRRYRNEADLDTSLRIAGTMDFDLYKEVHSKLPGVTANFICEHSGHSVDMVCKDWVYYVGCEQGIIRDEGAVWRRLNLDGCTCTYQEFMGSLDRLRKTGYRKPVMQLLNELRADIGRWK